MLVVKQGTVNHNGVLYGFGKPLPDDLSAAEAQRLIALGVCDEGVAATILSAPEPESPNPAPLAGKPGPVDEPIKIDFKPEDAIRGIRRK